MHRFCHCWQDNTALVSTLSWEQAWQTEFVLYPENLPVVDAGKKKERYTTADAVKQLVELKTHHLF